MIEFLFFFVAFVVWGYMAVRRDWLRSELGADEFRIFDLA